MYACTNILQLMVLQSLIESFRVRDKECFYGYGQENRKVTLTTNFHAKMEN